MAGKHVNTDPLKPEEPPVYPGTRPDRAYSEGRQAAFAGEEVTTDPHVPGTPESNSWLNGWGNSTIAAAQIQTAYAGFTI